MSSTPCVSPRNHAHRQKDALALPEISSSSSTKSAHSTRLNSRRHTSHWTPFGSWSVAIPLLLVHFLSLSVVNAQQRNRTDIVVFSNFCDCTLGCDDPPEPDCAPDISIIANDDEEGAFECDDDLQDCTWADAPFADFECITIRLVDRDTLTGDDSLGETSEPCCRDAGPCVISESDPRTTVEIVSTAVEETSSSISQPTSTPTNTGGSEKLDTNGGSTGLGTGATIGLAVGGFVVLAGVIVYLSRYSEKSRDMMRGFPCLAACVCLCSLGFCALDPHRGIGVRDGYLRNEGAPSTTCNCDGCCDWVCGGCSCDGDGGGCDGGGCDGGGCDGGGCDCGGCVIM